MPSVAPGPGVSPLPAQALPEPTLIGTWETGLFASYRASGRSMARPVLGGWEEAHLVHCALNLPTLAVSPTWWLCCPDTSETAEVESFLLLEDSTPSSTDSCSAV